LFLVLFRALADTSTEVKRRQAKSQRKELSIMPNNLMFLGQMLCAWRCGEVVTKDLQRWLQEGLMEILIVVED
ncbi:16351_t:CDS:2, partial [Funneliformis geosporum]